MVTALKKQLRVVVDAETWTRLNREKKAGEDFNTVILRLLDLKEASIK